MRGALSSQFIRASVVPGTSDHRQPAKRTRKTGKKITSRSNECHVSRFAMEFAVDLPQASGNLLTTCTIANHARCHPKTAWPALILQAEDSFL